MREYGVASASEGQVLARERCHVFERIVVVAPVLKIDPGNTDAGGLGRGFAEPNQPLAVRVGQRPQKHRVDDAENGGVRADAERERQNDDQGEAWRLANAAQAVPDVLKDGFEPRKLPRLPRLLLRAGHVAEGAASGCAGFGGRHAAFDVFGRHQVEMGLHLVGEIAVEATAKMQGAANL